MLFFIPLAAQQPATHRTLQMETTRQRRMADLQREPGPRMEDGRLSSTPDSMSIMQRGYRCYKNLAPERERRRRNRDYVYGDQWREMMDDPENPGHQIREEEYIRRQGRIPWKINRLLPIVRHAKGQVRQNQGDRQAFAVDTRDDEQANAMTELLRQCRRINHMKSLEADNLQEHIIGGKSAFRVGYQHWGRYDRSDVLIQKINMLRMFYNSDASDRRGLDLRVIGMIHDMSMGDVIQSFAPRDPDLADAIEEHYGSEKAMEQSEHVPFGSDAYDGMQFYYPTDTTMCRVIEVWEKRPAWQYLIFDPEEGQMYNAGRPIEGELREEFNQQNEQRQAQGLEPFEYMPRFENIWYGYYLTPQGGVLWEGPTPFEHQEHPFVLGWADHFDGETMGLIDALVDQQRLYNRMIQQMDVAMNTAARGVLMIPEEMIPDGMDPDDFADEYTKTNGVLVYKAKPESGSLPRGIKPEQVYNQSVPASSFDWLAQMKNDLEDSSGMQGPLMGETPKSGTPAALYHQQVLQGQTNTLDLFELYFETLHRVDVKALQTAVQYYEDGRPIKTDAGEVIEFDRQAARDIQFDVSIATVGDTATYRQLFEQDLKEYRASQEITFRQFLQLSSHPKAEALLKLIERTNPLVQGQAEQGQQAGSNIPPEIQSAMAAIGATPEQMANASPQQMQQALTLAAENGDRDAAALLKQSA